MVDDARRETSAPEFDASIDEVELTVVFRDGGYIAAVSVDGGVLHLGHEPGRGWWCSCGRSNCVHLAALRRCTDEERLAQDEGLAVVYADGNHVRAVRRFPAASYRLGFEPELGWWCSCSRGGDCLHVAELKGLTDPEGLIPSTREPAATPKPTPVRKRRRLLRSRLRSVAYATLSLGVALLGYVGYQLWGTGIETARAQSHLRSQLAHGFPSRPIPGGAIGYIVIPKMHLNMAFVQGVGLSALSEGPGHYPQTPLPGQGGNVAIAAHRTTHLAPFWSLDSLAKGDQILLQTRGGTFIYQVVWKGVGPPSATWVLNQSRTPILTLTTCNPRFSATQRLVVRARQVYGKTPGGFLDGNTWLARAQL
jgi:sortase A